MSGQRKPTAPPPSLSPGRVSVPTAVRCGHKHSRAGGQGDGGQDGQTGKQGADLRNALFFWELVVDLGVRHQQVDREVAKTAHLHRTVPHRRTKGAEGLEDVAVLHFHC